MPDEGAEEVTKEGMLDTNGTAAAVADGFLGLFVGLLGWDWRGEGR